MKKTDDVIIDIDGNEIKNKKNTGKRKILNKINAVMPLLSVVAFLILGYCFDLWHPGWIVFLSIPLTGMITGLVGKKGKSALMSLTTIVTIISYLLLGLIFNAWHPGWIVFFAIPIMGVLLD